MVDNLIEVGWLRFDGKYFEVPNLDRHLSKGSKQRAVETRKKQIQRKRGPEEKDDCPDSVPVETGQLLSSLILSNQDVSERSSETDSAEPKSAPANYIAEQYGFAFGQKVRITNKRKAAIRERWKDPWWRENWRDALEKGSQSEFLMGRSDSTWKINFEFFLKPDTVTKIMEGVYDGQRKLTTSQHRENANANAFNSIRAAIAASGD
jgi:hypothetical protein